MEKALVSLALKTEDKAAEDKEPTCPKNSTAPQISAAPVAQVPTVLKGVSQSLLDRVSTLGGERGSRQYELCFMGILEWLT